MKKNVFICTGEQSGDMHGAALVSNIKKITNNIDFYAVGGDYLKQQNVNIIHNLDGLSVMGVFEVLKNIFFFKKLLDKISYFILELNPEIVILIDYPGFNLKLAEKLRKSGFKNKIVYYISPQIWAWHTSRVYNIDRLVDKILVLFRFEKEFYDKYITDKNKVVFAGHPILKRISEDYYFENILKEKNIIAILPGSRDNELKKLLPFMLECIESFSLKFKEYKFVISAANKTKIDFIKKCVPEHLKNKVFILAGNTYTLLQRSKFTLIASGTATLEAGIIGIPMVVLYKINYFSGIIGKLVLKIKNISIINIVLKKTVVKEFVQSDMKKELVLREMEKLVSDKVYYNKIHSELIKVREKLKIDNELIPAKTIIDLL
jgi:lipid-A-disaccharide synthase